MNILMMSNTYTPIVGGLEKSIQTFTQEYRKHGHRVVVVAPTFKDMPLNEEDVIRVPAAEHFNGTDFSVQLPIPNFFRDALKDFRPDIVHAHHPFLMGGTALRVAYQFNAPLVYTYHTLFEYNIHYVLTNSSALRRFVCQLSIGYANLADQVFAPSAGIQEMLRQQGVESPVAVVPTGINLSQFSRDSFQITRKRFNIREDAYVVGYVGRLEPEKNIEFLLQAVVSFFKQKTDACFLVVGKGSLEQTVRDIFRSHGMQNRLFLTGVLTGPALVDAYRAMDVFAFASQSETQGISLIEALASGVPVVTVNAIGISGLIETNVNGILLDYEDEKKFAHALGQIASLLPNEKEAMSHAACASVRSYSEQSCAEKALEFYRSLIKSVSDRRSRGLVWGDSLWAQTLRQLRAEWELVKNMTKAATTAVRSRTGAL